METKTGVVFGDALIHGDIARYLEADSVAVVVTHGAAADGNVGALEKKDTAVPAAVHRFAGRMAARSFDVDILNCRVVNVPAADPGEAQLDAGMAVNHVIVSQRLGQPKRRLADLSRQHGTGQVVT